MKRILAIILLALLTLSLAACGSSTSQTASAPTPDPTASSSASGSGSSSSSSSSGDSSSSFTNAYGTPTTKCAHSGCDNYIASSGDTNCCTTHSSRCLNCGKYVDEDAMYCMSCITESATRSSSGSSSSGSSSSSSSSHSGLCQFKSGGEYVCNNPATNGSYCQQHYDYLNDAYNDLFG